MPQDALLKLFMPPVTAHAQKAPPKNATPPKPPQKPADRESDPAVLRARALCDFAWKIIEDINKDYQISVGEWEKQFAQVLAAVELSNTARDATMEAVKEERAQDAAKAAFINNLVFSLLTVGSMAYLGEFVKAGLPKLSFGKENLAIVNDKTFWTDSFKKDSYFAYKITTQKAVVTKSPFQFNEFQANVFGDILKDSGSTFIPQAFPKPPETVSYSIDTKGGLESLRADIKVNVEGSKQVVVGTFKKIMQWLNQESEFGEAWLAHTEGNMERARNAVLHHIEKQREGWAKKWEFFGKTPLAVSRGQLAEFYERAWWATYIVKVLTIFPYNKEVTPESEHFRAIAPLGRGDRKWVERAIIDRLRKLNVVFADTYPGLSEQSQRAVSGAPTPEFSIDGAIDAEDADEALKAYRWAKSYVEKASAEAAFKHFPPAKMRKLEPLRAASY